MWGKFTAISRELSSPAPCWHALEHRFDRAQCTSVILGVTRRLSLAHLRLDRAGQLAGFFNQPGVTGVNLDCLLSDRLNSLSGSAELAKYSCFFVNVADRFEGVEPVDAATDTEALAHAEQLLRRARDTKAVEVWMQGKMVGRVDRERS